MRLEAFCVQWRSACARLHFCGYIHGSSQLSGAVPMRCYVWSPSRIPRMMAVKIADCNISWSRSTMIKEILCGLALLFIHRDILFTIYWMKN